MMSPRRRKTYDGSFKAKVVLEYINGNKSLKDLSDQFQVHPNQIKNWKSQLLKRAETVLTDHRSQKRTKIRKDN
jgi:transposase